MHGISQSSRQPYEINNIPIYRRGIWGSEALGNLTSEDHSWNLSLDFIWFWCLFIQVSYLKASSLLHGQLCWGSGSASCGRVQRRPTGANHQVHVSCWEQPLTLMASLGFMGWWGRQGRNQLSILYLASYTRQKGAC